MSCLCEINDATLDSSTDDDDDPPFFQVVEAAFCGQTTALKGRSVQKNKRNCKDSFPPRGNNKKRTDKDFFF